MHLFFRFYYLNLPLARLYGTIKKCIIKQLLFFFFIQVGAWLSSRSVKKDLCNADKWEQLCQSWVRSYPLFSSSSQKGWLWLHNTAHDTYKILKKGTQNFMHTRHPFFVSMSISIKQSIHFNFRLTPPKPLKTHFCLAVVSYRLNWNIFHSRKLYKNNFPFKIQKQSQKWTILMRWTKKTHIFQKMGILWGILIKNRWLFGCLAAYFLHS